MRIKWALMQGGNKVFSILMVFTIGFAVGTEMALKYPKKSWALLAGLAILFCAFGKMLIGSCKHTEEMQQK